MKNPDHAYVINLKSRTDRWNTFTGCKEYPYLVREWNLEYFQAVDYAPKELRPKKRGVWGCYQSHLIILQMFAMNDWDTLAVFEDDVYFVDYFAEKYQQLEVPDDWDMLYLGGQCIAPMVPVSNKIVNCDNINRTHAYIVNRKILDVLLPFIESRVFMNADIDAIYGELHKNINAYICRPLLAGQRAGWSDVSLRNQHLRFWGDVV